MKASAYARKRTDVSSVQVLLTCDTPQGALNSQEGAWQRGTHIHSELDCGIEPQLHHLGPCDVGKLLS